MQVSGLQNILFIYPCRRANSKLHERVSSYAINKQDVAPRAAWETTMSHPSNEMLYDMFVDWLEEPIDTYQRDQIEALWNEFIETYPDGIEAWDMKGIE